MAELARPLRGGEVGTDVEMVQRALSKALGPNVPASGIYGEKTRQRMEVFQRARLIQPARGHLGQKTLNALWVFFDPYGKMRYRAYSPPKPKPPPPPIPPLGPVYRGKHARSVLEISLTHATDGIDLYPAWDDGWDDGLVMIAPEPMVITRQSSSQGGDAVYAEGVNFDWWFGHLADVPGDGERFFKGQPFAVIANISRDHCHTGINCERLLGRGKQFAYGRNGNGPDYTIGAPTIRQQLEAVLL